MRPVGIHAIAMTNVSFLHCHVGEVVVSLHKPARLERIVMHLPVLTVLTAYAKSVVPASIAPIPPSVSLETLMSFPNANHA